MQESVILLPHETEQARATVSYGSPKSHHEVSPYGRWLVESSGIIRESSEERYLESVVACCISSNILPVVTVSWY